MMNDVAPPKRPLGQPPRKRPLNPSPPQRQPVAPAMAPESSPIEKPPKPKQATDKKPKPKKKIFWWIFSSIILLIILGVTGAVIWYNQALRPVNEADAQPIRVTIAPGTTPTQIGNMLEDEKLIRSAVAFDIYTRLSGTRRSLQAGSYSLSPSVSTQAIVEHLTAGKSDQLTITFIPGETLANHKEKLIAAGYSEAEVDTALKKKYDHPLFATKPASADLEGYIYGETYIVSTEASVEDILKVTFDEYYKVIQENKLIEAFKKQDLSLFEGITLASIVQREDPRAKDQRQIAQVFLLRLGIKMPLGADPTYKYAAEKLGVAPTPELDSPYNTRKYGGLPPGPIASPGESALVAVGDPAQGDYLYFLSGDDDVTYFAHTEAEHEKNIQDHCQVKCSVF